MKSWRLVNGGFAGIGASLKASRVGLRRPDLSFLDRSRNVFAQGTSPPPAPPLNLWLFEDHASLRRTEVLRDLESILGADINALSGGPLRRVSLGRQECLLGFQKFSPGAPELRKRSWVFEISNCTRSSCTARFRPVAGPCSWPAASSCA